MQKKNEDINKIKGDIESDIITDDSISCISLIQFSSGFLGGFKFESISRRRNSYASMFRKQRFQRDSLHSFLTE